MAWQNPAKYGDEIGGVIPHLLMTSPEFWPKRLVEELARRHNLTPQECINAPENSVQRKQFDDLARLWRTFAESEEVTALLGNSGLIEAMPGGKALLGHG